tara:strand:+ start:240 stop:776 length:537 start_codon:yes stop_codon:yes gene_type:complete
MNLQEKKTIVLTGMMGSGKTTIGKNLASRLKRKFFDSDHEVSKAAGLSIWEVFKQYGENYFRNGEKKVITRLLSMKEKHILSIGGGAFMNEELRQFIIKNNISVWLDADCEVLYNRLKNNWKNRPLLNGHNLRDRINELLKERRDIYSLSHIHVKVGKLRANEITEEIILKLTNENHY